MFLVIAIAYTKTFLVAVLGKSVRQITRRGN